MLVIKHSGAQHLDCRCWLNICLPASLCTGNSVVIAVKQYYNSDRQFKQQQPDRG
jgi:hypothetical protein